MIGIPLAVLTALLYLLALYIGRVYVALLVGRKVLGKIRTSFSTAFFRPFAAGTIIIGLLSFIPVFGWLFKYCLMLMGAGAMWLVIWEAYQADKKTVEIESL